MYVRRREGERYKNELLLPTVKHGRGSIMVWGAISASGTGDFVKMYGIMDKKVYHNILVRHGVPSGSHRIGLGFIFQKDNDPKHSSHYCRNYLRQKEYAGTLKMMDRPPQIWQRWSSGSIFLFSKQLVSYSLLNLAAKASNRRWPHISANLWSTDIKISGSASDMNCPWQLWPAGVFGPLIKAIFRLELGYPQI